MFDCITFWTIGFTMGLIIWDLLTFDVIIDLFWFGISSKVSKFYWLNDYNGSANLLLLLCYGE